MITGEDRSKYRFKNWQLCGVWKLPFCDHRTSRRTAFALPIRLSTS